jgi:hypothetical protein
MNPKTANALYEMDEEEMMNEINNYLEQIESEYSRIRGKWSPLSPMDWTLAQKWEDSGIPLHIVLTAMSEVFRKFEGSKKGGKINSLSYFTQEVEKQFASWSESQVGKNTEAEIDSSEVEEEFEFEVEPLSDNARIIALESLRLFKSQGKEDFIKSIEPNYTTEDWTWLMENLEGESNNE